MEGDAEQLPFDDQSFDVVISVFGCMFAPEHRKAAEEIARVLKPGGQAVFVNFTRSVHLVEAFREVRQSEGLRPALTSLLWVLHNAVFESMSRRNGPH